MSVARPSYFIFPAVLCAVGAFVYTLGDAAWLRHQRQEASMQRRELVVQLQLTDLCLFTEARYTRHLSQADLHSAFQDHPSALEKFPSGSLVPPPAHLTADHEPLDREAKIPD